MIHEPMDPAVKAEWLEALRSGRYLQAGGRLHFVRDDAHYYCCLGVLTDLHLDAEGERWEFSPSRAEFGWDGFFSVGSVSELTPPSVMDWSGLADTAGSITHPLSGDFECREGEPLSRIYTLYESEAGIRFLHTSLTELNDEGFTFDQIADMIEYFM